MQEVRSSTLLCSTKDFRPEAACLKPSGLFVFGALVEVGSSQSGRIRLNLPKMADVGQPLCAYHFLISQLRGVLRLDGCQPMSDKSSFIRH